MRVLHVGNIANNAYNNAKFQRRAGIEADALVYDYSHVMGQPEWEDAPISEDIGEWFTDWSQLDLGDWIRPSWFKQVRLTRSANTKRFKGELRIKTSPGKAGGIDRGDRSKRLKTEGRSPSGE